jgi:hypothetical protein
MTVYAAPGDHFPGGLTERGATAQTIRVVPPVVFTEPEILAQEEVGQAVTTRADKKPSARSSSKPRRARS